MKNIWNILLLIILFVDIILHYCGSNSELNYYATIIAAFAVGLYLEEWLFGKSK